MIASNETKVLSDAELAAVVGGRIAGRILVPKSPLSVVRNDIKNLFIDTASFFASFF